MESGLWNVKSELCWNMKSELCWNMKSELWLVHGEHDDVGVFRYHPERQNEEEQKMGPTIMESEPEVPKEFKVSLEPLELADNTILY